MAGAAGAGGPGHGLEGKQRREMRTWLEEARLAGVSMYSKQSGQWLEVCIVLGIGYPRSMIDQP